jgi:hypothetical protein
VHSIWSFLFLWQHAVGVLVSLEAAREDTDTACAKSGNLFFCFVFICRRVSSAVVCDLRSEGPLNMTRPGYIIPFQVTVGYFFRHSCLLSINTDKVWGATSRKRTSHWQWADERDKGAGEFRTPLVTAKHQSRYRPSPVTIAVACRAAVHRGPANQHHEICNDLATWCWTEISALSTVFVSVIAHYYLLRLKYLVLWKYTFVGSNGNTKAQVSYHLLHYVALKSI